MLCEPIFKEIKSEIDGVRKMVWGLFVTSGLAFITAALNIIVFFAVK